MANIFLQTLGKVSRFLGLTDVPDSFVDQGRRHVKVKQDESGLEFLPLDEINIETMTTDKYPKPGDKRYQWLTNTSNRGLYLFNTHPNPVEGEWKAGDRFIIRNNNAYNSSITLYLYINGNLLDYISAGKIIEIIHNGAVWVAGAPGGPENDSKRYSLALGGKAKAYTYGVSLGADSKGYLYGTAVGRSADGYSRGVGIGYGSDGYSDGVAIGYLADGYNKGVGIGREADGDGSVAIGYKAKQNSAGTAVGREANANSEGCSLGYKADSENRGTAIGLYADTNQKERSVALGMYTNCTRTCENCTSIAGKNFPGALKGDLGWFGIFDTANWEELYLGWVAGERLTLLPSSVLAFKIMVVAKRETNSNYVAYYHFEGVIQADSGGTVSLSWSAKTVKYEDPHIAGSWDCRITPHNNYLMLEVLGTHGVDIAWCGKGEFVEIQHF